LEIVVWRIPVPHRLRASLAGLEIRN